MYMYINDARGLALRVTNMAGSVAFPLYCFRVLGAFRLRFDSRFCIYE